MYLGTARHANVSVHNITRPASGGNEAKEEIDVVCGYSYSFCLCIYCKGDIIISY